MLDKKIEASSSEMSSSERGIHAISVELGAGLISLNFCDTYWRLHRRLEQGGKIKHSAEDCPERAHPPEVREWHNGAWHTVPTRSEFASRSALASKAEQ